MKYIASTMAATALVAMIPATASARDGEAYGGLQAGLAFIEETEVNVNGVDDVVRANHDTGYELAAIAGYDFGQFRLEGDIALSDVGTPSVFINGPGIEVPIVEGRAKTFSAMANALVDFGKDDGIQFSAGAGIGLMVFDNFATVDTPVGPVAIADDKDSSFAWQLIAETRYPVTETFDLGLRYRFKRAEFDTIDPSNGDMVNFTDSFHSVLATATFNF